MPKISNKTIKQPYYIEIDIARGFFLITMAFYHTAFILAFFYNKILSHSQLFWEGMPLFISGGFLILAGISLHIAAQRGKYTNMWAVLKRSGSIFCLGLLITVFTSLFDFGGKVYFGILHCIGLATFISYYLLKLNRYIQLLLGLLILAIGIYARPLITTHVPMILFWLYPTNLSLQPQLDYYPLIPYMGFILLGTFLGKTFYPTGKPSYLASIHNFHTYIPWLEPIRFLGRHSLTFYLLHTPIIFSLLHILAYLDII